MTLVVGERLVRRGFCKTLSPSDPLKDTFSFILCSLAGASSTPCKASAGLIRFAVDIFPPLEAFFRVRRSNCWRGALSRLFCLDVACNSRNQKNR